MNRHQFIGGRGGAAITPCQDKQTFLLCGGTNRDNVLYNDFWKIRLEVKNGDIAVGKQKITNSQEFSGRTGHSSITTENGDVYIFGGQNFEQELNTNELWEFRANTNILVKINDATGTPPSPRNSHGMVYHQETGSIYIFGGADGEGPKCDFFKYSIKCHNWEEITVPVSIKGREMLSMNLLSPDSIVMIGGRTLEGLSNQIICYNLTTNTWNENFMKLPKMVCAHSSTIIDDKLYLFGGINDLGFSDIVYSIDLFSGIKKQALLSTLEDIDPSTNPENVGIMATSLVFCEELKCFLMVCGSKMANEIDRALVIDRVKLDSLLA